jgi:hypothetical protein
MLLGLFLWPGRMAAKLFCREREMKKEYRSRRQRSEGKGRAVLLSLVLWLAVAGALLYALDRAGQVKEALDAGVEAAQGERLAAEPDNQLPSLSDSGETSAGGTLSAATPEPATVSEISASLEAPEVEAPEMWLVILHSIPRTARAEAERRQAGYKDKGLEVDILDTSAFPKLPPNFWVIALGPFDNRAEALAAADRAKTFNPGLMVRRGL